LIFAAHPAQIPAPGAYSSGRETLNSLFQHNKWRIQKHRKKLLQRNKRSVILHRNKIPFLIYEGVEKQAASGD